MRTWSKMGFESPRCRIVGLSTLGRTVGDCSTEEGVMARSGGGPRRTQAQTVAHLRACAATCRSDDGSRVAEPPARSEHRRFDPPREPVLGGSGGVRLLMGIPGFAGLWETRVPESALRGEREAVVCTCNAGTALDVGVTECSGRCGRFFLRLADVVLVKRFDVADAA